MGNVTGRPGCREVLRRAWFGTITGRCLPNRCDRRRVTRRPWARPGPGSAAARGAPPDAGGVGSGARLVAGRYRLESVLGRGAMGTVWAATDEVLQRRVAIKQVTLPPGLPVGEAAQLRQRALREARAVAALSSPYIITVFDVLTVDGEPVIVMELLPSRSLAEVLGEVGRLTDGQAGTVGVAVGSALLAAHAAGVTHRDVKPANVLIGDDGRVKLTDFGIARSAGEPTMTGTGLILGSAAYLAPEVAKGAAVGPGSDTWSLGGLLFACVRGPAAVRPGHPDRHVDLGGEGPGAGAPALRAAGEGDLRVAVEDPAAAAAAGPGGAAAAGGRGRPLGYPSHRVVGCQPYQLTRTVTAAPGAGAHPARRCCRRRCCPACPVTDRLSVAGGGTAVPAATTVDRAGSAGRVAWPLMVRRRVSAVLGGGARTEGVPGGRVSRRGQNGADAAGGTQSAAAGRGVPGRRRRGRRGAPRRVVAAGCAATDR